MKLGQPIDIFGRPVAGQRVFGSPLSKELEQVLGQKIPSHPTFTCYMTSP